MSGILVFFHCGSNAGFAIERLERVFLEMSRRIVGEDSRIHFAYPDLSRGRPIVLPVPGPHLVTFDPGARDRASLQAIERYVRDHQITLAFGFDQQPRRPGFRALRRGGVERLLSYWGAPMSSLHRGVHLLLKRLDVALSRSGPDHYIFESEAMRETAVAGRGIPRRRTEVVHLGVDTTIFSPTDEPDFYAHDTFAIPRTRKIVYYSGHFEARKGVAVIVRSAIEAIESLGQSNLHFLLLGNREGEERPFLDLLNGSSAAGHVTFGGYRQDVPKILKSATLGVIASTGWDSFTMSSIEMAASGLPLLVSNLQGLRETVEPGRTGYSFPVGDHRELARLLCDLVNDAARRDAMGRAARQRVLSDFTVERQIEKLAAACRTPSFVRR